jgi:DNA-binding transcriptional LysR family regulator
VVQCAGATSNLAAARWLRALAPNATVAAYTESWPGLVLALKSGAGISPLPNVYGDSEGDLVRVIDTIPDLVTHFYLLTHHDMYRTPRVRAFFEFLEREIRTFRVAPSGKPVRHSEEARRLA